MGHEKYLTEVYRKYPLEDLRKFYLKGESALLIFTEAQEVTKLRKEVEQRNQQLQVLVNGLTSENLELKRQVSENTKKLQELEKELPKIEELIKVLKDSLNCNKQT